MMKLVADDRDGAYRVKKWFMEKGTDVQKRAMEYYGQMKDDSERKRNVGQDAGPTAKRRSGFGHASSGSD